MHSKKSANGIVSDTLTARRQGRLPAREWIEAGCKNAHI